MIEATDGMMALSFTPYAAGPESVVLVAKNEISFTDPSGQTGYSVTVNSLVLSLGESVFYYPLGVPENGDQMFVMKMEILVLPYHWFEDRQVSPDDFLAQEDVFQFYARAEEAAP
jgi:hypothetical protein